MPGPDESELGGETAPDSGWYQTLLSEGGDIIAVIDSDGEITYVNSAVARILGYEPGDLIGHDWYQYAHPEDEEALSDAIETLAGEHAERQTVEFRCRQSDGEWCWLEATMRSRLDGKIAGIIVNARDVTERKKQTAELKTTRERMKIALEGAKLGIWDWDMETDEVVRDELLTEMLGYTQSEMGNDLEGWKQVVHPAGKERHDEALAAHIEDKTPYYQCEHRLKTKAGDWNWVRTMGKVVERDETGEPVRAVGIHQDIDDRKRADLAIETERDMFKEGPAVVFKWEDTEGWPITYVSENVESVFGYTAEELRSSEFRYADLIHHEDLDRLEREMAEHESETGDPFNPEPYRVRTADDGVRWVMEYTKDLDEDGERNHILGYIVDITERKQRERELEAREEKYRNLFEDTRDALMLLDRDGFFDCNQQTLDLFGLDSVDEFTEHSPWDLSPPTQPDGSDTREAGLAHVEAAFDEGTAFFEWTHQRVDGTEFPAEVKLSRFEHQGEPALHALVRNVTEQKKYERQLKEQRDNLDILNQVLRHDIRNDIQLIMTYAEMLEAGSDDAQVRSHVETILENADHAVELTKSAREMAEVLLSAEKELEQTRLDAVLASEIEEVRDVYPDASVTEKTALPQVSVHANDMLGSVFRNLLKNAIQHNDTETPKVTVSATDRDETAVVRVADNGPGVPDGQKKTIFGKGQKGLDSQGTGIGLYLVKTLVESYDGDIWVEDNDHSGSGAGGGDERDGAVFVVEIPKSHEPV
jgi:PAS domain S-box-containing protein